MQIIDRFKSAWNAFRDRDPTQLTANIGAGSSSRIDRYRPNLGTERSMAAPLYTRLGIDVSSIKVQHARLDQNGSYLETIDSGLNRCLTLEANIDQSGRAFMLDAALSLFGEGCIAIVPVDTTIDPSKSGSYDIRSMRTGKIVEWYPQHVRVNLYNDKLGIREDITLPKRTVAIIENPLYNVMNEPNGTLKRLIAKLNLLDSIDLQSGSGKLDLIIQFPYAVKTTTRIAQAESRRLEIEKQMAGSKYGIAYIDGTEKVTQLNRPAENNLMVQVEYLTNMLYSQLGLAESIFDGTADEKTMINYHNRTVEPILGAIVDGMRRSFLTDTGRSQGQSVVYFRNLFGLMTAADFADMSDKMTRNEILTSNEVRGIIGVKPSKDKGANELRNKNIAAPSEEPVVKETPVINSDKEGATVNGSKRI